MARILIHHGWKNHRPEGHWHRIAATELRRAGHVVSYPQFPNPDEPTIEAWQQLLLAELEHLDEVGPAAGELIVIAHSLGCINWIQAAASGALSKPVDRVLLVAPADPALLGPVPGANVDVKDTKVRDALLASAGSVTIVASDGDPWTPQGIRATFGEPLGLEPVVIPGAGHLSLADGWGAWSGVISWVNDPQSDLSVR